tara:strand:+ start:2192 stop:2614 length:423 start_codon:yes stop_codon:yes gene_type:complete
LKKLKLNMVKLLKYIFVLAILSAPLKAEVIKNIQINGNKRISDETIKIYGEINKAKQYSDAVSNDILKNLYDTGFFENVEVLFNKSTLVINLKEYPTLNQLIIIGEESNKFEEEIRKIINSKQKKSFNKLNLVKDKEIIF